MRFLRPIRVVMLTACVLAASTPAWSQEQPGGFAKVGGFAAVTFMPGFTFDGVTFDGETAYQKVDGEELVFLPKIDKQPLIRAILGYRAKQVSLEISYDRTQHDGSFAGTPMEATFQAVNIDGRYYFAPSSRIQPHVLAGGSFPWFSVEDGSVLDGNVGDARFRGYGVNTEAGVTVYPHRQLGIGVGYVYRVIWFDRATGVADEFGELRPRFRETSGSVAVTATYVF